MAVRTPAPRAELPAWLDAVVPRTAEQVARGIAGVLAPEEAPDPAPPWLRAEQVLSFRRLVAAVRRYGGALLAEPVGSGKTYIALAAGERLAPGRPVVVVAPAVLVAQWRATAKTLGVPVDITSHERLSRGQPVPPGPIVVVDESHRFRNPATVRYRELAQSLVGRRAILVSATPLFNHVEDLTHQLLLSVRGDALRLDGVPSLRTLSGTTPVPPALEALIVSAISDQIGRPHRSLTTITGQAWTSDSLERVLAAIDRLRLSKDRSIAALIRTFLTLAAASSPAALLASVGRYRLLLAQARDAGQAGHRWSRRALVEQIQGHEDQLVFWSLLAPKREETELALGDDRKLQSLGDAIVAWEAYGDRKLGRLQARLEDGRPTLVFATAIETVHYLRRRLAGQAAAWCTGAGAGIGPTRMARERVLGLFRPEAAALGGLAPRVLLATEVAAEGLDLQRVERVIHYDLPWTAVRLAQRDGRAIRLGAAHPIVDVIRFELPDAIERRLRLMQLVDRKARLPELVGLGADRRAWTHRARIVERIGFTATERGAAAVQSDRPGVVAAFRLEGGSGARAAFIVSLEDGSATTNLGAIEARLAEAIGGHHKEAAFDSPAAADLEAIGHALDERLRTAHGEAWLAEPESPAVRAAIRQVHAAIRLAASSRDGAAIATHDRALRFLRHGHTAGERIVVAAGGISDWAALGSSREDEGSVRVTLVGLLVFRVRE
ncbi:MAG: helicase-related protein [Gemmatimonadota bacterium]